MTDLMEWLLGSAVDKELPEETVEGGKQAWAAVCLNRCLMDRATEEHKGTALGILAGRTGVAWSLEKGRFIYRQEEDPYPGTRQPDAGWYNTTARFFIERDERGVCIRAESWARSVDRDAAQQDWTSVKIDTSLRVTIIRRFKADDVEGLLDAVKHLVDNASVIHRNTGIAALRGRRTLAPHYSSSETPGLPFVGRSWRRL